MKEKTDFGELKKRRDEIVKKWKDSGLLDGLNGNFNQNIAELFQGQATQMIEEEREKNPTEFPSAFSIAARVAKQWCDFEIELKKYQIDEDRIMF